jgi:hypothetical protein
LRDKGDLQNAKLVADQAVNLLAKNRDSQDFKIATALVKELTDKIAQNPNAQGTNTPATAGTQQSNLPEGVAPDSLNNAPEVSTPAAVKKNPAANIPNLSPTATPKQ